MKIFNHMGSARKRPATYLVSAWRIVDFKFNYYTKDWELLPIPSYTTVLARGKKQALYMAKKLELHAYAKITIFKL